VRKTAGGLRRAAARLQPHGARRERQPCACGGGPVGRLR
jgi:hypothetical protein